jgi:hypothetical protein
MSPARQYQTADADNTPLDRRPNFPFHRIGARYQYFRECDGVSSMVDASAGAEEEWGVFDERGFADGR